MRNLTYKPISSVWYGNDADLLEQMLSFYPHNEPHLILDATINRGSFWFNSPRKIIGMDIDARHTPNVCGDCCAMPYSDSIFDAMIYDPPHIPNYTGGGEQTRDYQNRYGLGGKIGKELDHSFGHTYSPFLIESYRTLKDGAVLFCKITDYVHNHKYRWSHIDLIREGASIGFTPCDMIIKVRKGAIISGLWTKAHHSKRTHSYWIIFRKSHKCE